MLKALAFLAFLGFGKGTVILFFIIFIIALVFKAASFNNRR